MISVEKLENFIDSRYEANALQEELDWLETIYDQFVSEDELSMTEEELNMSEAYEMGVDLEEWLINEYVQYIKPELRCGGREDKDYFTPDSFNDFMTLHLKPGVTRKDIIVAAKDIYEWKASIIQKRRLKNKLSSFNILSRF